MQEILIAFIGMSFFGLFWAIIILVANNFFAVKENPVIEQVVACLPGVNCGACGFAGCNALGEAIVLKDEDITSCTVIDLENKEKISKIIGKTLTFNKTRLIAKLHCSGSIDKVQKTALYCGIDTCFAEHITSGSSKSCTFGCLGRGDCVKVCIFDALKMTDSGLPQVDEKNCTACGKCLKACPRDLFKLVPKDQKVFILCSSHDPINYAKKACAVACIACGICSKLTKEVFVLEDDLVTVNYQASQEADIQILEEAKTKCPQKIIT